MNCSICNTKEENETFMAISDPLNLSERFLICRYCRENNNKLSLLINEFYRIKLDLIKQYTLVSHFLTDLKKEN